MSWSFECLPPLGGMAVALWKGEKRGDVDERRVLPWKNEEKWKAMREGGKI